MQLKMELCFIQTLDLGKTRNDFHCKFCKRTWNHDMRCSEHRVIGCPLGLVDSEGNKIQLPVYPNLKPAADFHVHTNMAADNCRSWLQGDADKHVFYEQHPELQHHKTGNEGALYRVSTRESIEGLELSHPTKQQNLEGRGSRESGRV